AASRQLQCSGAVLFMDLNRFKTINDTLGHQVGDILLRKVAKRLRETLRNDDLLARLGGDEFIVLLPGASGADAVQMALTLKAAFDQPLHVDHHEINVYPSIGISLFPQDGHDLEKIIHFAD